MTTRTRTPAEVEAGARALGLEIFPNLVFDTVPESTQASFRRWTTACLTAAADAAAAPAVGVSDRGETAIEAARELLLMLHLEVMTGASLVSPAVETLMTELDNTIFAWDAAQMEPKGA